MAHTKEKHFSLGDVFKMRKDLKLHYKALYVAIAFVGLNFCWFGVWTTIARAPYLNNPLIAVVVGVILLKLTGKINDLA